MKKHLIIFFLLILSLSFSACSTTNPPPVSSQQAPPPTDKSSSMQESETAARIEDKEELDRLWQEYLRPAANQGLLKESWESPEKINPQYFIYFYFMYQFNQTGKGMDADTIFLEFPAQELEAIVQQFFDVSTQHLRQATSYNTEKQVYIYEVGAGFYSDYEIIGATREGDRYILEFARPFSKFLKQSHPMQKGILAVEVQGDRCHYLYCETENTPPPPDPYAGPLDFSNYEQLTQRLLFVPASNGILVNSWSNASDIMPDRLLGFFKQHQLMLPEDERAMQSLIVPAQTVEDFVMAYFDVTADYLRSCEYYNKELNVYVFPEGISGAPVDVVDAKKEGDRLTLYYQIGSYAGFDMISRYGNVVLQMDGDNYKYLSCETSESLLARLLYPATTGPLTWTETGVSKMTHSGTSGDGTMTYSGTELSDIIGFYETELAALGATGEPDSNAIPGRWVWSGLTAEQEPLNIEITPVQGDDTFLISLNGPAIMKCKKA